MKDGMDGEIEKNPFRGPRRPFKIIFDVSDIRNLIEPIDRQSEVV